MNILGRRESPVKLGGACYIRAQLYLWRRAFRATQIETAEPQAGFVPATIAAEPALSPAPPDPGAIEIDFASGARMRRLARLQDRHQHGRQGRVARQRVRGAALEIGEIRGGLPQCLRHGRTGSRVVGPLSRLLQSTAPAFEP
jgi:hypothetical protein